MSLNNPTTILNGNTTENTNQPTPINAVTGKAYVGNKAKRLQGTASYFGYTENTWATMKQWNSVKQTIAKGEKGTLLLHIEKPQDDSGEVKSTRSFVYNRCQLESHRATDCGDKAF